MLCVQAPSDAPPLNNLFQIEDGRNKENNDEVRGLSTTECYTTTPPPLLFGREGALPMLCIKVSSDAPT